MRMREGKGREEQQEVIKEKEKETEDAAKGVKRGRKNELHLVVS